MVTKTKQTFGGAKFSRISTSEKAINVTLPFEEGLKLHLAILEALGKLNRYNRSTKAGRNTALHLAIFPRLKSITVLESKLPGSGVKTRSARARAKSRA